MVATTRGTTIRRASFSAKGGACARWLSISRCVSVSLPTQIVSRASARPNLPDGARTSRKREKGSDKRVGKRLDDETLSEASLRSYCRRLVNSGSKPLRRLGDCGRYVHTYLTIRPNPAAYLLNHRELIVSLAPAIVQRSLTEASNRNRERRASPE